MDYSSNDHLQEVCEIKQPVLFEYKSIHSEFFSKVSYDTLSENQFSNIDIKVKDINDYWSSDEAIDYIILPFQTGTNLLRTDPASKYFTENNEDFLEESGLFSLFKDNDTFIKPYFTATSQYDICTGSKNTVTPLRYHTGYRQYLCVNTGKISVKMTPWKSTKLLYPTKDFENYEFRSPINVWKPQKKYIHEMDKIKFLEFDVLEGNMLFIPPYWWYSIKYTSDDDTLVSGFTYHTIMNCVANSPDIAKYYLQQYNIKKRITKTLDLHEKIKKENAEKEDNDLDNGSDNGLGNGLGNELEKSVIQSENSTSTSTSTLAISEPTVTIKKVTDIPV